MITTLVAMGIAACCCAKPVPETEKLDPEKYTIQFTLASVGDNYYQATNALLSATDMKDIQYLSSILGSLDISDATYTNYATACIENDHSFSTHNGLVSGTIESNCLLSFKLKFERKNIQLNQFPIEVNKWTPFGIGKGNELEYFILIKLYEPKKSVSNRMDPSTLENAR